VVDFPDSRCFLGDVRTSNYIFFLSFFGFGPSWVGVGLGLGVLGDLGTSSSTSTSATSRASPYVAIATSGTSPSFVATLALIASIRIDMMLCNNSYISFGNVSNTKLAIKTSNFSWFMCA